MIFNTDKKIVDGIQHLIIGKLYFRFGNLLYGCLIIQRLLDNRSGLIYGKLRQDSVQPARVGIDADQFLRFQIFQSIGDKTVLSDGDNRIIFAEYKIR